MRMGLLGLVVCASVCAAQGGAGPALVEFNRDIRPVLSDKCFLCHGPDSANRMTKLRWDLEESAKADLGGRFAIVPGNPGRSEMIRRITASDPAARMPPVQAGARLTDREIELLRRWVEQGARWGKHWSLIPPQRPPLPGVSQKEWPRNGIDYFVLERLERERLRPMAEADRATLIRRVSLDLTGLPPSLPEIDAFLNDPSPNAYEKVVDRLLASPRFGERMAARWLDGARYADTNGYQTDAERFMWRWRDWVIEAFNRNLPFDRFTIEQIAGDMLPNATLDQKIATGFNRNHRGNGEGGIIPEEYAIEYVADRVETTSTVWLGLTMGCARCHDHKYDPITQKEFYQVFAYFNNIPEKGRANKYGNSPPLIPAPTPEQQAQLKELEQKLAVAERHFLRLQPEWIRAQRAWEASPGTSDPGGGAMATGLVAHYSLDGEQTGAQWREGEASLSPGRIGQAASFDGKRFLDAGNVANFGFYDKFTLAAWIYPQTSTGAIVTRTVETPEGDGYGLYLNEGKVQLNLVQRWLDDALRVETSRTLEPYRWRHVLATYDGSRAADGVQIYFDGEPQKLKVLLDELNQSFQVREPLRIGAGGGPGNRFQGLLDDVRVYNVVLSPEEAAMAATPAPIAEIVAIAPARRTKPQADKLALYYLDKHAPAHVTQAWREWTGLRKQRERFLESIPTVMVMQENETPRQTFLLNRGAYDKPAEKVSPGVPASLPPLPAGSPNSRLGFARWLVDASNPLTARVAANRFWQMYFGTGLVRTVEDFGSQGEWPSHPELLDWLATELIRTGWDLKALQKTIVMGAVYRQSSQAPPAIRQRDPDNRLLARGPRFRLPAEFLRDQALAISGLLVEKIGGRSVKPYQPAGLWKELSGGEDYKPDQGENLYRRSLYTYWKRAAPPPSMMNFDAAGRETCIVRETRTNTPAQALNLMNDVTYLEAARVLAQRMMKEGGPSPEERIGFAFRLATARWPTQAESRILLDSYHYYLDNYQTDGEAAGKLLSAGQSPREESLNAAELAAFASVASLILNLDETVNKQ